MRKPLAMALAALSDLAATLGAGRAATAGLCLALLVSTTGCAAVLIGAAGGTAGAVYVLGKLQDEIGASLPAVHDAARATLRELDLPARHERADRLTARLESELADGRRVWIDLESMAEARTRVTIRVGLMGDEVPSRQILEGIKQRLAAAPA